MIKKAIEQYEEYLKNIVDLINFAKAEAELFDDLDKMLDFYQGMAYGAYQMLINLYPALTNDADEISAKWDEKIREAVKG